MTSPIAARRTIEAFSLSHAAILDGATDATDVDIFGVRTASIAVDLGNSDNTGDDAVLGSWNWVNYATVNVEGGFLPFDLMGKMSGTAVEVGGDPTPAVVLFTPAAAGGTGVGDAYDYSGPAAITFTVDGTPVALNADYGDLAGVVAAVDAALGAGYTVAAVGTQIRIRTVDTGADATITIAGADAADVTGSPGYSNVEGTNGDEFSLPFLQEDAANQPPRPLLARAPARDRRGFSRTLDIILFKVAFTPITFTGPAYKTGMAINFTGRGLMSDVNERGVPLPGGKRAVGRLLNRPQI